jgi:hypothetical protein
MVTTVEQKMIDTQAYVTGAEVDFSKGEKSYKYGELGRCRIVSIQHLRVWTEFEVEILTGERKGKVTKFKTRGSVARTALGHFAALAPIAAKSTKAKREKAIAASDRKWEETSTKLHKTLDLKIEPGDIVEVTDTSKPYDDVTTFRVYEVDYKKFRIKGWKEGRWESSIGSKMGYFSTAHDSLFKFKIVKKAAFNVETDPLWLEYKRNTAAAGAKRANTRARRTTLRGLLGDY